MLLFLFFCGCLVKFLQNTSWLLCKPTLAAKAGPAVLHIGHPGTAMKVSVSLARPVQTHAGNLLKSCESSTSLTVYTGQTLWNTHNQTISHQFLLPLFPLNSSSTEISFQFCFWVEIPDEWMQKIILHYATVWARRGKSLIKRWMIRSVQIQSKRTRKQKSQSITR